MADDPQSTPGNGPEDDQGASGTGTATKPTSGTGKDGEGDQADAVKSAETARAAAEKRATEAEQEAARLRRSNAATKGTDLDALRAEVRQEFTEALVRAELRAAAAGKLRDPADALALLDVVSLMRLRGRYRRCGGGCCGGPARQGQALSCGRRPGRFRSVVG